MAQRVFSVQEWTDLKRDLSLSCRQAEVIERILLGHSDKQIAHDLQITVPTVRTYLCRIFSRLGVGDRYGLMAHVYARFREGCQTCGCPRLR